MEQNMTRTLALLVALAPSLALAAGSVDDTPPTPTATTETCDEGYIYDDDTQTCVIIQESSLNPEESYDAVRELAYAGRYSDAQMILAGMDQSDDRVMTYLAFTNRKLGNTDLAMAQYYNALAVNPNNLLARSYMGQAYVEVGAIEMAQAQLTEINARGGRETWPAKSLRWAIESGKGSSY